MIQGRAGGPPRVDVPESDGRVSARNREGLAVRAEYQAHDRYVLPQRLAEGLARRRIPEPDDAIGRSRQDLAVGAESQSMNPFLEGLAQRRAGCGIEELS